MSNIDRVTKATKVLATASAIFGWTPEQDRKVKGALTMLLIPLMIVMIGGPGSFTLN